MPAVGLFGNPFIQGYSRLNHLTELPQLSPKQPARAADPQRLALIR